jgi:phosphorylcholine metabolism protein LicD
MSIFIVLENKRPACYPIGKYECWKHCAFHTLQEAIVYANDWLGEYAPSCDIYQWELDKPFKYSEGSDVSIHEMYK